METSLIYTCNIGGDLALLPRLHTFIREARQSAILIDLGNACSPQVWHCEATQGRSTLMVLDAMGYDVAYAALPAESRAKLHDHIMMSLVDEAHAITYKDILFTTESRHDGFEIIMIPGEQTYLQEESLYLQELQAGEVGFVSIKDGEVTQSIRKIPPRTAPDPSISGTVEFVLSEARYFQRKNHHQRHQNGKS